MKVGRDNAAQARELNQGFTLLEVMIAYAVFFIAIFAILGLVSHTLSVARHLEQVDVDISSLASTLSMTSPIEEGDIPLELRNQFEDSHPGYTCSGNISLAGTNGLFRVDLEIRGLRAGSAASTMSILLYRPESTGTIGGAPARGSQ